MKKTIIATTLLALSFVTFTGLAGCHAEPQDTHTTAGVPSPR